MHNLHPNQEEVVDCTVQAVTEALVLSFCLRIASGTARKADCGFSGAANQGQARGGLCLGASTSTSTSWSRQRTLRATDHNDNRGYVSGSDSGAHPQARRGTEFPKKCSLRKRRKGKFGRDSGDELFEAAMARAREEENELLQATMAS